MRRTHDAAVYGGLAALVVSNAFVLIGAIRNDQRAILIGIAGAFVALAVILIATVDAIARKR